VVSFESKALSRLRNSTQEMTDQKATPAFG
jgi:hypothetical protein